MTDSDKPLRSRLREQRDLVYGEALGGIVFLTHVRARQLAQMYEARRAAKTWGEFKRNISSDILREIGTRDDDGDAIPDSDSFADHDPVSDMWPFPSSEQIEILPDDVIDLGELSDTSEGDRLDIPVSAEAEALKRLHYHGVKVERDDALVKAAVDSF
jgi:hypothetical protein